MGIETGGFGDFDLFRFSQFDLQNLFLNNRFSLSDLINNPDSLSAQIQAMLLSQNPQLLNSYLPPPVAPPMPPVSCPPIAPLLPDSVKTVGEVFAQTLQPPAPETDPSPGNRFISPDPLGILGTPQPPAVLELPPPPVQSVAQPPTPSFLEEFSKPQDWICPGPPADQPKPGFTPTFICDPEAGVRPLGSLPSPESSPLETLLTRF